MAADGGGGGDGTTRPACLHAATKAWAQSGNLASRITCTHDHQKLRYTRFMPQACHYYDVAVTLFTRCCHASIVLQISQITGRLSVQLRLHGAALHSCCNISWHGITSLSKLAGPASATRFLLHATSIPCYCLTCTAALKHPAAVSTPTARHILPSECRTWCAQRCNACALSVPRRLCAIRLAAYLHSPASCSMLTASAFSPAEQLSGTPSSVSPILAA